jgi:thiamine-phosphate pyrophosphorylase
VPVVAIGGITLENAPRVLAAGADCVAVIAGLFDAPNVRERATLFQRLFEVNTA